MKFEVSTCEGYSVAFDQYADALAYIDATMAQWNNFMPDTLLQFKIRKVPDDTDTVNVAVGDMFNVGDRLA